MKIIPLVFFVFLVSLVSVSAEFPMEDYITEQMYNDTYVGVVGIAFALSEYSITLDGDTWADAGAGRFLTFENIDVLDVDYNNNTNVLLAVGLNRSKVDNNGVVIRLNNFGINNEWEKVFEIEIIPERLNYAIRGIAYSEQQDRWVIVGDDGYIAYSDDDGDNWTETYWKGLSNFARPDLQNDDIDVTAYDVAYANDIWVLTGGDGQGAYSYDGVVWNWTAQCYYHAGHNNYQYGNGNTIRNYGNLTMISCNTGQSLFSYDGIDYTGFSSGGNGLHGISYSPLLNIFISGLAVSNNAWLQWGNPFSSSSLTSINMQFFDRPTRTTERSDILGKWIFNVGEFIVYHTANVPSSSGRVIPHIFNNQVRAIRFFENAYIDYTITIYGCTNETAFNYNPDANTDDGSCIPVVEGCTDPSAFNYNPDANTDDGSCEPIVYGCTNPSAFNYNINANVDDGSCEPIVYGCTNPSAFNYEPNANTDDGSCIPVVEGCTDSIATNYNPDANTDDGSCTYPTSGGGGGGSSTTQEPIYTQIDTFQTQMFSVIQTQNGTDLQIETIEKNVMIRDGGNREFSVTFYNFDEDREVWVNLIDSDFEVEFMDIFEVKANDQYIYTFSVDIPLDIEDGNYSVKLNFISGDLATDFTLNIQKQDLNIPYHIVLPIGLGVIMLGVLGIYLWKR